MMINGWLMDDSWRISMVTNVGKTMENKPTMTGNGLYTIYGEILDGLWLSIPTIPTLNENDDDC